MCAGTNVGFLLFIVSLLLLLLFLTSQDQLGLVLHLMLSQCKQERYSSNFSLSYLLFPIYIDLIWM